ncbi:TonB-dependent receptor [Rhizosaccharibacter radicis]|uniref:TonB-dependent receptor n=1 Tax=Rhizosaccharibacter radicis TaxID=2782605 RepID=A0ABT1W121_9PROT|nr:TonB-dependent receptor [Acetobacteraceae bacterium KSS12]
MPAAIAQDDPDAEAVTVRGSTQRDAIGGGLMLRQEAPKSVSSVTSAYIAKQAPSSNPYQLLKLLPGANAVSADPYGMTTGNLTVRGLNSDQIGFTLDGASLNDIGTYSAFPTEWVDSENLSRITLEQGSANLDTPVIGASGGIVEMRLRDPSMKAGGLVNLSYGSYHTDREFIRLDSGEIGRSGVRAFVSYSRIYEPHFRGPGEDHKQHVDFKALKDWRNGSTSEVALTFDDSVKTSYRSPSLAQWQTLGRDFNYDASFSPGDTNFYKLHQTPYRVIIVTAPQHVVLGSRASLDITPYFYFNGGSLAGASVLSESGFYWGSRRVSLDLNNNGSTRDKVLVYSPSITPYVYRPGVVSKLNYSWGRHHLVVGDWYEWSATRLLNPYSPVGANGGAADEWGQFADAKLSNGVRVASYDNYTETQVNSLFLGDRFEATSHLTLEAGFKETMVNRTGYNYLPGAQYRTELNDAESLPTIAARYRFDDRNQLFADVATNFRTPTLNALYSSYSATTGAVTTAANPSQKAEYAISEELGYRYQGDLVNGTVTLFNYNFTNRQVATQAIVNGAQVTQNINAGGQTSRGVDAEIGLRPFHHFRPYVSAEYLHATIDNDYQVGADALPTAGKRAVRAPEFQGAIGLDYDQGNFFGNLSLKYTGRQFSTFTNDQAMPAFVTADIAFGYRLPTVHGLKPELRLNLINVGDNSYLSGVAGVAASSRATTGVHGTTIAAQGTPTYYVGGGFAALLTASCGF